MATGDEKDKRLRGLLPDPPSVEEVKTLLAVDPQMKCIVWLQGASSR
ncbi:hypothetical protein ABIA32_000171 [Streptacidiphilus sp. MAP12-20]